MKVAVFGTGYVGLVQGAVLADVGHEVLCVDVDAAKVAALGERIVAHYGGSLQGKTIAVWGLAFKPDTDDMREAPSRTLLQQLWAAGARVRAYDPAAAVQALQVFGTRADLTLCDTPHQALQGADALAIVTEWKAFRAPDFEAMARLLADRMVFDGRNLYDPAVLARHGLGYVSMGRPPVAASAP